jgi:hypothetical protein
VECRLARRFDLSDVPPLVTCWHLHQAPSESRAPHRTVIDSTAAFDVKALDQQALVMAGTAHDCILKT